MFKKIRRYLKNPYWEFGKVLIKKHPNLMPDKYYLSIQWWLYMGYKLDWKHPRTFNEKLQWLKLYDRNPLYTTLVDKYTAKKWVADLIGEEYIVKTLKLYDHVDDINLEDLPEKFVLKCTHDSGSVVICQGKDSFDIKSAKEKLQGCLEKSHYLLAREWPYKNVPRKIIAEEYLESSQNDLWDYKFFCFDGKVKFFKIDTGRYNNHLAYYFDREGNKLPYSEMGLYDNNNKIETPNNLFELIQISENLSRTIPFVRVDFYSENNTIKFGEYTFYPGAGHIRYTDDGLDESAGRYINLAKLIESKDNHCKIRFINNPGGGQLIDYKFFCFNGSPKIMYVSCDKSDNPTTDFFDMDFNLLPIKMRDANSDTPPSKPPKFNEMKELAKVLSKGIPEVRVDFYIVNNQIKVGELTFFHNAGYSLVQPKEWNEKLGEWIELPI